VAGVASDDAQVAAVEVKVDDGNYEPANGTSDWTFPLDTSRYGNGNHSITARATDAAGNTASTTTTVNFENTSDTQPPSVSIASPVDGAVVSGEITVSGAASDDAQVAAVEVKVDEGNYEPANGTCAWKIPIEP